MLKIKQEPFKIELNILWVTATVSLNRVDC